MRVGDWGWATATCCRATRINEGLILSSSTTWAIKLLLYARIRVYDTPLPLSLLLPVSSSSMAAVKYSRHAHWPRSQRRESDKFSTLILRLIKVKFKFGWLRTSTAGPQFRGPDSDSVSDYSSFMCEAVAAVEAVSEATAKNSSSSNNSNSNNNDYGKWQRFYCQPMTRVWERAGIQLRNVINLERPARTFMA